MAPNKILIVEDEILIADNIKRILELKGYEVVSIAISYEEAIRSFDQLLPDIVLLDIRLNGQKSGIDVAKYINQSTTKRPFLFLTSQIDQTNIEAAKKTLPSGYLSKPIQHDSLSATIEITLHRYYEQHKTTQQNNAQQIRLTDGTTKYLVDINDIIFIQSEHVYVKVFRKGVEYILHRSTLKDILSKLPQDQFIQTHRSFVVNLKKIKSWDSNSIYIDQYEIPMSRSKKKEVLQLL